MVDTLGLPISIQILSASVQERDGAPSVIVEAKRRAPRLTCIWGDSGFAGRCVDQVQEKTGIALKIVKRSDAGDVRRWCAGESTPTALAAGFKVLPRRWVVERTFAWLGRYRRHSKDYEANPESSLAWAYIAFVRLLVQRFAILMETA